MNTERRIFEVTSKRAALVAIGIGVVVTVLFDVSLSIVEQTPQYEERGWLSYIFQVVLVTIPFLLMAFLEVRGRGPWLTGLGMTAALWVYVVFDTFWRLGDGSGANIGLGLLILASPILISAACLFAARRELGRS